MALRFGCVVGGFVGQGLKADCVTVQRARDQQPVRPRVVQRQQLA